MKLLSLTVCILTVAGLANARTGDLAQSPYDVVAPSISGPMPADNKIVGQIYYDTTSGGSFKGVNSDNSISTLSTFGSTSVTSGGTSERVERALVSCSSSSSVSSASTSGWLTIGNNSSGVCTVGIASGTFSATPTCVATTNIANPTAIVGTDVVMNSATSFSLGCHFVSSGSSTVGNCVSMPYNIICMGPR